jgi:putative ABC transport system substrate-binding protein
MLRHDIPTTGGGMTAPLRVLVVILMLGLLAAPLAVGAQSPGKVPRVGVLSPHGASADSFFQILREELHDLGYVVGRNIALEYRSAEGVADRLPSLAAGLVRLKVDVIVTTTPAAAQAAKQATTTIPIVLAGVDDAVEQGFVGSLAHPGGNITGVSWLNTELSAKRIELLKEVLPKVSSIAVVRDAVGGAASLRATEQAARVLGVRLQIMEVREPGEFANVFSAISLQRVGAVIVLSGPMVASNRSQIVDLVAKNRLPAIFSDGTFVEAGGLISYGPRLPDLYRRAAAYVDKILRGAKPGTLPVEQPTQFEMRVNLRTAKALRLTVPPSILRRADDVIQ